MKRTLYLITLVVVLIFQACKGTKNINTVKIKKMSANKIIAHHYDNSFDFETINAKLSVRYNDDEQSYNSSVTLRIKKDSVIWLSAKFLGITVAKAKITPSKVQYYLKVNKTYFDGNFEMISDWIGTELDFQKIQNLLLGEALYDLKSEPYEAAINERGYLLSPKKELALFDRLFTIDPITFKMVGEQLKQAQEDSKVSVKYTEYQEVEKQKFPKAIRIEGTQKEKRTLIEMDYRSVDYNARVSFPFKIPAGFKEVIIE